MNQKIYIGSKQRCICQNPSQGYARGVCENKHALFFLRPMILKRDLPFNNFRSMLSNHNFFRPSEIFKRIKILRFSLSLLFFGVSIFSEMTNSYMFYRGCVLQFPPPLQFHPGKKVSPTKGFSQETPASFVCQTTGGKLKYTTTVRFNSPEHLQEKSTEALLLVTEFSAVLKKAKL